MGEGGGGVNVDLFVHRLPQLEVRLAVTIFGQCRDTRLINIIDTKIADYKCEPIFHKWVKKLEL